MAINMFTLQNFKLIVFSGSRHGAPERLLSKLAEKIPESAEVMVGCAKGVDAQVRALFPNATVKKADEFGSPDWKTNLVRRSTAIARHSAREGGCLIAFPMIACPEDIQPCGRWVTGGRSGISGTWSTIALCVGLGGTVLLWLPPGIQPPAWGEKGVQGYELFVPLGESSGWYLAETAEAPHPICTQMDVGMNASELTIPAPTRYTTRF